MLRWECIHFGGCLAAAFGGVPTSLRPCPVAALKRLCSPNMQATPLSWRGQKQSTAFSNARRRLRWTNYGTAHKVVQGPVPTYRSGLLALSLLQSSRQP